MLELVYVEMAGDGTTSSKKSRHPSRIQCTSMMSGFSECPVQ